jgi:hypothetical protein
MIRSISAFTFALACDVVLVASVFPLAHFSLTVARSHGAPAVLLIGLLLANIALLAVCFAGFCAWFYALFQSLRATHASVANEVTAMNKNSTVSNKTTPAN